MALRSSVPQRAISRDQSAIPKGFIVAIVVALVAGLTGVVFFGMMLRERNAGSVSAGGLTLKVESAQWVNMDTEGMDQGFQMPQQMMPGAPSHDQQRLAVAVTISNGGGGDMQFSHTEFSVQGPDGQVSPLVADDLGGVADPGGALDGLPADDGLSGVADDLGSTHLGPGLGLSGSLSFDLPATSASQVDKGLFLLWSRAGKVVRVPVTIGAAAAHDHH